MSQKIILEITYGSLNLHLFVSKNIFMFCKTITRTNKLLLLAVGIEWTVEKHLVQYEMIESPKTTKDLGFKSIKNVKKKKKLCLGKDLVSSPKWKADGLA